MSAPHAGRPSRERGSALTATLGTTAVVLPMAAFALLLARGSFYIQNNTRAQAEALYVAEAGLTHALADVVPEVTLTALLDGPDQRHGTADDGVFPFREGSPGFFPRAPFRYDVSIESVNATLFRLTSTGYGQRNARVVVEGLALLDPQPYAAAAVYSPALVSVALGRDFLVSGFDHVAGDAPDHPTGSNPALPAVGVGSDTTAGSLRAGLQPYEAAALVGKNGPASIAAASGPDLEKLITASTSMPGGVATSVSALASGAHLGTASKPQVTVLDNDAVLGASVDGVGILIAPRGLRIAGSFSFAGVMLVRGDLTCDPTSDVRIDGGLGMSGSNPRATFAGRGAVTTDRALLAGTDQQFPNLLPHGVLPKGWREVF
ncbi:MAG TPA: hypothetical protein VMW17_12440 [Candidatus Binatia bacterium]|nr:hypothetical protein [Candidatus Binatia bacterium]